MIRHNLSEQGIVSRFGGYKICRDCFEEIYSEREWIISPCPGKILKNPKTMVEFNNLLKKEQK